MHVDHPSYPLFVRLLSAIAKLHLFLLAIFTTVSCFAAEPGPDYELVSKVEPDADAEFFGGPHIDIVTEVYRRRTDDSPAFKIVLSSLADPSRKELFFAYDRAATAELSPDGQWFIVNDRPFRGQCAPRLFKHQSGLKFAEVKTARIRARAIDFFVRYNKYPASIREHMIGEGDCIVESEIWGEDSKALLLRIAKGRTGEPIWIQSWRCVYDLKTGKLTTDLRTLNRDSISPGKYLAPKK